MYSSSFHPTRTGDAAPGFSDNSPPADRHRYSDEEIPEAPEYWTLEDFRDIVPGPLQ
jgi:hypothetical protein